MSQVLEITITETPAAQEWVLHGKLAANWVAELESNWENTRSQRDGRKCLVDLKDVTFIDERGEKLLLAMKNEGAHFLCHGVLTKHQLATLHKRCR